MNGLGIAETERFLRGVYFNHDVAECQREYALDKGSQSAPFHFADIADDKSRGRSMGGRAVFDGIIDLAVQIRLRIDRLTEGIHHPACPK